VHLAADGPAVRARGAIRGQQAAVGDDLGEVLADRERVPHLDAIVRQARHPDARRQQQDLLTRVGIVRTDDHLIEREPGEARHQPTAQRPGRIVLAAEGQRRFRLDRGTAAARRLRRGWSFWRHAPSASTGWRLATWKGLRLDRAVDGRATTDPTCDAF
jgi:hypothetical protein